MEKHSAYYRFLKESNHNRQMHEDDDGFFTYVMDAEELYIENIFVEPESRRKGIAGTYLAIAEKIAKEHGCLRIVGSVIPTNPMSTESLKGQLLIGFRVVRAENNFIVLSKEIN